MSYSCVYGQFGMTSAGPSSFDFVDLSNSTLAGPSHSGVTNQFGMQGLMPTPVLGQTSMQPALAGLTYRQCPNPTQPISTSYSLYQDRPSQNHGMGKTTRKRPRSPKPTQEQRLSAIRQQLSKRTGVPELSLDAFCFNPDPAPKRSRTSFQKQNKKDVENAGGACFLCVVSKRKVFPFGTLSHSLPICY